MKKVFLILCISLFVTSILSAQEFKIQVSVNAQIPGTDRTIYESMQKDLNEFINTRKWTNFNYKMEEKIEGTFSIIIKERISQTDFKGDINIQLRRPVYNSLYTTTLLNTQELDFTFKYQEGANLQFEENTYYDNLTSTIAFYLYYFLAIDGDTFAQGGGIPYFKICQNIVTASQKCGQKGWKSFENDKNKYWMSENYNNVSYRAMHDVWYNYHLMGLDRMNSIDDQVEARTSIFSALESLQRVYREKSQLICIKQFIDAKADEIVQIFKASPDNEKERVIKIMTEINPSNTNKYEQIRNNKNTNQNFTSPNSNPMKF